MKKQITRKTIFQVLAGFSAPVLFTGTILTLVIFGLDQAELANGASELKTLEEGLLRASAKCYATEGRYPESIEYIEEHYGVRIDRTKYAVFYEAFASNICPEITVVVIGEK